MRDRLLAVLITGMLACGATLGCIGMSASDDAVPLHATLAKNLSIEGKVADLRAQLTSFADRYLARIGEVGDEILGETDSIETRLELHEARCISSYSVVELAGGANPAASLLDLMSMTRLQKRVFSRGRFAEMLGEANHTKLTEAFEELAADMWSIGAENMSSAQLDSLAATIDLWLELNPERDRVSTVRFNDFTKLRGGAALKADIEGTGWFPSVGAAASAADSAIKFAARTRFVAERMPLLLGWQTEMLVCGLMASPEIGSVLDAVTLTSKSLDQISVTAAKLPESLAAQSQELSGVIAETRATIEQIQALADPTTRVAVQLATTASTLTTTIETADQLAARFSKEGGAESSDARPFDITEYTAAAEELATAAREIDQTLKSTRELLDSDAIGERVTEIGQAADRRVELASKEAHSLLRSSFLYGLALLVIGCVLALTAGLIYRVLTRKIQDSGSR